MLNVLEVSGCWGVECVGCVGCIGYVGCVGYVFNDVNRNRRKIRPNQQRTNSM
jgi:hypothetical protein